MQRNAVGSLKGTRAERLAAASRREARGGMEHKRQRRSMLMRSCNSSILGIVSFMGV